MYWLCQRGYRFGELLAYAPAKREVPGSKRPADAVSGYYTGARKGTTRGQQCLCMCGIVHVVARGQRHLYGCSIAVTYESKEVEEGSLMRVTVAYPRGRVDETEGPHGVDFRCCTATAQWSGP